MLAAVLDHLFDLSPCLSALEVTRLLSVLLGEDLLQILQYVCLDLLECAHLGVRYVAVVEQLRPTLGHPADVVLLIPKHRPDHVLRQLRAKISRQLIKESLSQVLLGLCEPIGTLAVLEDKLLLSIESHLL